MAIKRSIGKLILQKQLADIVRELQANGFDLLGIEPEHTLKIEVLPFLHRDPFDRMLVAQAIMNDLTLISNEAVFDKYGAKRLW
ncbi:MAG: type II toxin-antitoxin system VapC family toxin [Saprospiraceae bacterium]